MGPSHAQLRAALAANGIDDTGDYSTLHARLGAHLVARFFSARMGPHAVQHLRDKRVGSRLHELGQK